MEECEICKKSVAETASTCPHCGHDRNFREERAKSEHFSMWFSGLFCFFISFISIAEISYNAAEIFSTGGGFITALVAAVLIWYSGRSAISSYKAWRKYT